MAILYRQAKPQDIESVPRVYAEAIDDLHRRRGFFEEPTNPLPLNQLYSFMLSKVPEAFWVAEYKGEIVGYSVSWIRASFWFLMDLFILSAHQSKGIGRSLIEKTLESWQDVKITNRAVITPAYNPSSISLYTRFIMYPREPLYFARASPNLIRKHATRASKKLDFEVVASYRKVAGRLGRIDRKVLGFALDWHHECFFEVEKAKCLIFEEDGRPEGYAYVRQNGRIGPLAVLRESFLEKVMSSALLFAAEQGTDNVLALFAGSNERAVSTILKHGLRIDIPMLFMSSSPVRNWKNYLPYSPGLM
ncbi:MAG: N-acetyltransferase family protein [Candidatus Bathyarchaeia archaeon]